jgi:aminoglycoside phosphotransferase
MPSGFFPAVEPDSPVFPLLDRLQPAVQAEVEHHAGVATTVHTELRTAVRPTGEVELRRFYWSLQHPDPRSPVGFGARTVYCDAKAPEPQTYVFPAEPALTWLADANGPLRSVGDGARIEVLRYIPLRRLTCRVHDGDRLPPAAIAKIKRPGGLDRAARAFAAVQEAADRSPSATLTLPRLLRVDAEQHVLYLEQLPGEPLNLAVARHDLATAMAQLGALHRELQELDVRGLGTRLGTADWVEGARQAATQIGLFVPSAMRTAERVFANLARTAPEGAPVLYSQGDFLPGQVLCHPDGWSVIDLDDSRYADPLSEVAAMYVGLARELAMTPERTELARQTYLEAYARRSGERFDRRRFEWFVVLVELRELGKRLVKGRASADEVASVLERLTG